MLSKLYVKLAIFEVYAIFDREPVKSVKEVSD